MLISPRKQSFRGRAGAKTSECVSEWLRDGLGIRDIQRPTPSPSLVFGMTRTRGSWSFHSPYRRQTHGAFFLKGPGEYGEECKTFFAA